MNNEPLTSTEQSEFKKYFGVGIETIEIEELNKIRRQLQSKYHPDNFEKRGDATIREMAVEKFQHIEALCNKVKYWLENKLGNSGSKDADKDFLHAGAQYAYEGMYIEIITRDKDLKYHLFGSAYRWLEAGETYKIPKTQARITIKANYSGNAIGFNEAIKMYLSFTVHDSISEIVEWLYRGIAGKATSLIIEKNVVKIDLDEMNFYIRKKSFL